MKSPMSTAQLVLRDNVHESNFEYQHTYLHPCVINSQPYIVYHAGLAEHSPSFFKQIKRYFLAKGFQLKEEQRLKGLESKARPERRRWMSVLLVSAVLFTEASVFADVTPSHSQHKQNQPVVLELTPEQNSMLIASIRQQHSTVETKKQSLKSHTESILYHILYDHYKAKPSDPEYIINDLRQMANYYSQYPKVVSLLTTLKTKPWQLQYNENIWSTVATGSALDVDNAIIHFNTRSAAKLKRQNSCKDNPVCIASPADALLHELLHTHSMLVKTSEFIEQGGMNRYRYPYKHEYAIIHSERELYASMSMQDGVKRPQRNEHSGRKIITRCVTCIY